MIGTDIINLVRQVLRDEPTLPADRDFDDTNEMLVFLNYGVRDVYRKRPDALLADDGTLRTVTDLTALTGTVALDDNFKPALVAYVLSWCYARYGDYYDPEKASEWGKRYRQELGLGD